MKNKIQAYICELPPCSKLLSECLGQEKPKEKEEEPLWKEKHLCTMYHLQTKEVSDLEISSGEERQVKRPAKGGLIKATQKHA